MLDSRRASTGHVEVVPRSLLAVRRSVAGFRRLLLVAVIAFIAMPIALLVMFAGTPLELLPFAISIAGAVWFSIEIRHLERDLRRARVRALDAVDAERQRISRDLHDSAQQRLVSTRIHLGLLAQAAQAPEDREAVERIGRELDAALAEIRDVTRDSSPQAAPARRRRRIRCGPSRTTRRARSRSNPSGSAATSRSSSEPSTSAASRRSRTPSSTPGPRPSSGSAWSAIRTRSRSRSTTPASGSIPAG